MPANQPRLGSEHHLGRLPRIALWLVPARWRESLARDLGDEAARDLRRGLRREVWLTWQILRIAARFSRTPRTVRPMPSESPRAWNLGTDVRLALRSVRREPLSALAVMCTLALGTGAATATYAVVNHALLRPVPGVAGEDRLISVYTQVDATTPSRAAVSHAHLEAMRERTTALTGLAAWRVGDFPLAVVASEPPRTVRLSTVTRGFFEVLGVAPRLGRSFTAEEYESSGLNVLVISERLWRRRFNRDPAIVGRRVLVSGHPFEIIGVARGFQGISRLDDYDGWLAFASWRTFDPAAGTPGRSEHSSMVGRLAPGVSIDVAQAQLMAAFRSVGEFTLSNRSFWPFAFAGLSDGVGVTRARLQAVFRVMLAGVALLVVLACANAAGLMLARHIRRRPDLALRRALGAGRFRLLRELLVEAAGLALGACLMGLALATGLTALFRTSRLLCYLPVLDDLRLDWRVAAFGAVVSAVTIVLFALVPAWLAARADVRAGVAGAGRATRHVGWLRTGLVGMQVALSFALIVVAALLAQSVHRLQTVDFGFSPESVLAFSFRPTRAGLDDAATLAAMQSLTDRLTATPEIGRTALTFLSPLGGTSGGTLRLPAQDDAQAIKIRSHLVTGTYFDVLGLPVLRGRTFSAGESMAARTEGSPIILNDLLARQMFGTAPAEGQTVLTQARTSRGTTWQHRTVIGVVGNAVGADVRAGFAPFAYEPLGHSRIATVLMRPAAPATRAAELVRQIAREVAPGVPVDDIAPLRLEADESIAQERVLSRLSLVIGAIAAFLALAGLYAAVAQFVNERTREFAIRTALGATRATIADAILGRIGSMTIGGLAAGAALIAPVSSLVAAYLFGVSSYDPLTITATAVGLAAAAVAAGWPAIRRAARVDPALALRSE